MAKLTKGGKNMYTEENIRGKFPLRDILLKVIIVAIFIILIAWIVAKVVGDTKESKVTTNVDKVFSANIASMEEAALKYYVGDKIPSEVGSSNKITLRDMVNDNLLEAFTDSEGKSCDVTKSYVELTKNSDDYTLRVNLECNEKSDYTLTKVNAYDYCENELCERKVEDNTKDDKEEVKKEEDITKQEDTTTNNSNPSDTNNSNSSSNSNANNSNNQSGSSSNNNPVPPPTNNNDSSKKVMYEYRKVVAPVLSNWSGWSGWIHNVDNYTSIMCSKTDVNCLREVQVETIKQQVGTKDGKPVYGFVSYYSYRTRTVINAGSTDIKWSTYNDKSLLNNGYTYTGNTK